HAGRPRDDVRRKPAQRAAPDAPHRAALPLRRRWKIRRHAGNDAAAVAARAGASAMIGESLGRKEDLPLLTGRARFIDDIARPGMLHLGVVRSPHAHARIVRVAGGLAAADLPEVARPIPPYKAKQKFRAYEQPVPARTVVRYVGEPVAVVVAEDPRDLGAALDAVTVDYEALPAVSSTEAALRPGAARVHEQWPDNVAYVGRASIGDVDAAMSKAHLVV